MCLPVTLLAEPPLHAEIMMRSSMMVSLMVGLPDCTTKTSFSRTLVRIRTLVSPCDGGQIVRVRLATSHAADWRCEIPPIAG